MDEGFSPVIFLYGLAIILGVSKACTLLIWRTLARPRPGLRQDLKEAWQHRNLRTPLENRPDHLHSDPSPHVPAPTDAVRQS